MATVTVPKAIRASGKVKVNETAQEIDQVIEACRKARRQIVILHEPNPTREFRVRWSLIQAVE